MYPGSSASQRPIAWLSPLANPPGHPSPWLLTSLSTFSITDADCHEYRNITVLALLEMLTGVVDFQNCQLSGASEFVWKSPCERFVVRWHRKLFDELSLFVQQRSDYFSQIELEIDGDTVASFEEPVWPHLQANRPRIPERLTLPTSCIQSLDAAASELQSQEHNAENSGCDRVSAA